MVEGKRLGFSGFSDLHTCGMIEVGNSEEGGIGEGEGMRESGMEVGLKLGKVGTQNRPGEDGEVNRVSRG